jgi:hypothetical protein
MGPNHIPSKPDTNPPARPPKVAWHIDRPAYRPVAEVFEVHGWIAADAEVTAVTPRSGCFESFAWQERPDLVPPPRGLAWARGFRARAGAAELDGNDLACRVTSGAGQVEVRWTLPEAIDPERKARKLDRLRSLFRADVSPRRTRDYYQVLPADTPVAEPELVSGYHYPAAVDDVIRRHADGWILDCGAGHRPVYHDNVVNLEIAPFPSTDVLADAARLPFKDNCFDAVVTLATLEHVRRPWVVAAELIRVLKPGGTLIVDVPFLQPVHAYPKHYFNMTSEGLRSLFEDKCDIVSVDVPHYGRPIYTLAWFLDRYAAGLPEAVRAEFMTMQVQDLAAVVEQQVARDYVNALPKAFEFELASVTSIVARKR